MNPDYSLRARLASEFLGSLFLVAAAISPSILFTDALESSLPMAVLADALAVGFILFALIEMFGPISGAHFNPAVSFAFALRGDLRWSLFSAYSVAQVAGGFCGLLAAHGMFRHLTPQLIVVSQVARPAGNYLGEAVGTFVLVLAILLMVQHGSARVPLAVGLLVGGELIATSSTMFANPQVTFARMFTYSAAGVRPSDGVVFIAVQFLAAGLAVVTQRALFATRSPDAR